MTLNNDAFTVLSYPVDNSLPMHKHDLASLPETSKSSEPPKFKNRYKCLYKSD